MAKTKQHYIDSVHDEIGKVFRRDISKGLVEEKINQAYNQVCFDLYNRGKRHFELSRKRFNTQAVSWDGTSYRYYTDYPKVIVPDINMDMIVEMVRGTGLTFRPISERDLRLSDNLQSRWITDDILYVLKTTKIEWHDMESLSQSEIDDGGTRTPRIAYVSFDLAIQFTEFDPTDVVLMPGGRDYDVIQLAVDMLKAEHIMEVRND